MSNKKLSLPVKSPALSAEDLDILAEYLKVLVDIDLELKEECDDSN